MRIALIFPTVLALSALVGCAPAALTEGDVASVGGRAVTEAELVPYVQAFSGATYRAQTVRGKWLKVPLDGPDFAACVSAREEMIAAQPREEGVPFKAEGSNKNSCSAAENSNKSGALQALISQTWIEQAADKLGVTVSEEEVSSERDAQLGLLAKQSGLSNKELLARTPIKSVEQVVNLSVRNQLTSEAVLAKLASASEEQLTSYYQQNKDSLFPDTSYEQARKMISDTLDEGRLDDISATRARASTVCAPGYQSLLCDNSPDQNGTKIALLPTPTLAMIFFPEGARATIKIAGPLGGTISDDPSSYTDGGATSKGFPKVVPRGTDPSSDDSNSGRLP